MNAPHQRTVVVNQLEGGGWAVVGFPRGEVSTAARLSEALRMAERLAGEFEARVVVGLERVGGKFGPAHLLGGAVVYRAWDGDCWAVAVLLAPWSLTGLARDFVGPNAEVASLTYAKGLVGLIAKLAKDEQARRQRRKELASVKRGVRV